MIRHPTRVVPMGGAKWPRGQILLLSEPEEQQLDVQ